MMVLLANVLLTTIQVCFKLEKLSEKFDLSLVLSIVTLLLAVVAFLKKVTGPLSAAFHGVAFS